MVYPRHRLYTASLVLRFLHSIGLSQASIKVGDTLYLRVKQTGACITVENYNGEVRSTSVHAQYWHHGLWQELKVEKDNATEGDEVMSGDTINFRGHNGKWLEANNSKVQALTEDVPSKGLVIEKESGDGPVCIGDTVYLKAPSGQYIGVKGMDVDASSDNKGAEQAFILDTHVVGPFDGRWTQEKDPGADVFVIQGSVLHFVDDIEFGLFPQGKNKFTTGIQGWHPHDAGELFDGKIVWSNGDVWIPTEGPLDGRWTPRDDPGKKIFDLRGDKLRVATPVGEDKFAMAAPKAPDLVARRVGINLHWGNGEVWVPVAAGSFDGRWMVKDNPGGDFFDIESDMLFFDAGLESRIVRDGDSFTTELQGDTSHVKATLSADRQELHWSNGDVWSRFREDGRDFRVPPTAFSAAAANTTAAATTAAPQAATSTAAAGPAGADTSQMTNDTAITTTTSPTEGECFEQEVAYEPLDMDNVSASYENSAADCQRRCQRTPGCTHFTYWLLVQPGHCHLQDVYALHSGLRLGFVAGPASCYKNVTRSTKNGLVKLNQPEVGNQTYVPYAYRCLKMSRTYAPVMHSELLTMEKGYLKGKQAVKGCRELCLKTEGCFYYSIGFPARLCSLSPERAHEVRYIIKHISGPVSCDVEDRRDVQKWEQDVLGNSSNVSKASNAIREFLELQDLEVDATAGRQLASVQLLGGLGAGLCAALVVLAMRQGTARCRRSLVARGDTSKRMARVPSRQDRGDIRALLAEEDGFAADGFAE